MNTDCVVHARNPNAHSAGKRWRNAVLQSFLAVLGVACTDGYPTKDAPTISPSDMTRSELLDKMNWLGDRPTLDRRWQYELSPSCQLTATTTTGRIFGSRRTLVAALDRAEIEMRFDDADEKFDVYVRAVGNPSVLGVAVLEGSVWAEAIQMKSALEHLRQQC